MAEPLRLDWTDEALADLELLHRHMPAAAHRAEEAMRRMAERGFNVGRWSIAHGGTWYWPAPPLGIFYWATATTLSVEGVVDVRRLRTLA